LLAFWATGRAPFQESAAAGTGFKVHFHFCGDFRLRAFYSYWPLLAPPGEKGRFPARITICI
jgi:hypothetical protein